jgi:DNA-binding NarL/FixJ family response regulator
MTTTEPGLVVHLGTILRTVDGEHLLPEILAAFHINIAELSVNHTQRRGFGLTARETQVLKGMARGLTNNEIGRELYTTEDTVKTHARRLFRKLQVRDRAHAVAVAITRGLLGGDQ